jgi:hypothetical protein
MFNLSQGPVQCGALAIDKHGSPDPSVQGVTGVVAAPRPLKAISMLTPSLANAGDGLETDEVSKWPVPGALGESTGLPLKRVQGPKGDGAYATPMRRSARLREVKRRQAGREGGREGGRRAGREGGCRGGEGRRNGNSGKACETARVCHVVAPS